MQTNPSADNKNISEGGHTLPVDLFNSIVAKVAAHIPLLAKGMVENALEKVGAKPHNVTPRQMKKALDEYILPNLVNFTKGAQQAEIMGGGIIQTNAENRVLSMTRGVYQYLKRVQRKDISGSSFFDELHRIGLVMMVEEIKEEYITRRINIERPYKSILDVTFVPVKDKSNTTDGTISIIRDITLIESLNEDAKILEKNLEHANAGLELSEKKYRVLFDNAAEGILVAGIRTKKFKFANPAICRMLGYSQGELLQLDVSAIHPKEALAHVNAEFEAQARGEKMLAEELPCLLKNGTVIYADVKAAPMLIDGEICNVGFFTDITERKRMENQVRERMKELQAFYGLAEIIGREGVTLDKQYQKFADILPQSWQYTEIACARIVIGDSEFRTKNFMESAWKLSAPVKVYKSVVGRIDVCYLEERPELDEGPFLKEERLLIDAIAERLGSIAERKRTEEELRASEEKYRNLSENLQEIIYRADPNTFVAAYVNRAIERIYGYTVEEWLRDPGLWEKSIYPEDKKKVSAILSEFEKKGEGIVYEYRIVTKGNAVRWVEDHCSYEKDAQGKRISLNGIVSDITERKMLQEQLERKNREILDITNVVTHDLKKPLAVMNTICSLIENENVCTLKDDGREAIAMGKDAIGYMHELLEDLLACAKLEAGTQTMEYENIDSCELIEMVFQRFKLQAEEKNIKITKSVSGTIHADRKGMTKVFMNLIGNAVNYIGNTPNPEIIISSSFRETDNSTLFSIKDNGIGIPADIQKEIFQKFKRGTNVGGISGTGLGLSIVKSIVEAHCGKIWLESTEEEGTTFYFTLPVDLKTAPLK